MSPYTAIWCAPGISIRLGLQKFLLVVMGCLSIAGLGNSYVSLCLEGSAHPLSSSGVTTSANKCFVISPLLWWTSFTLAWVILLSLVMKGCSYFSRRNRDIPSSDIKVAAVHFNMVRQSSRGFPLTNLTAAVNRMRQMTTLNTTVIKTLS